MGGTRRKVKNVRLRKTDSKDMRSEKGRKTARKKHKTNPARFEREWAGQQASSARMTARERTAEHKGVEKALGRGSTYGTKMKHGKRVPSTEKYQPKKRKKR